MYANTYTFTHTNKYVSIDTVKVSHLKTCIRETHIHKVGERISLEKQQTEKTLNDGVH